MILKKTLLLLLIPFFIISCSSAPKPTSSSTPLRVNLPQEPTTLDPRKGGDIYSSALHFLLFDGLTKITEKSSCDFGIAKTVDISSDGLSYTFHLRDAFWSNGAPIEAGDIEFSWKTMLEPDFPCPNAHLLYNIYNAENAKLGLCSSDDIAIHAVDAKTLEVKLKSPTPYFLKVISFCVFYPVHKTVVSQDPRWADQIGDHFITSGPYKISSWKHHDHIILEKNPYFWDAQNVSLEKIHISFIDNENTALEMFEKKELDIVGSPYTNLPLDALSASAKSANLKAFPVGKTIFCSFNLDHPILKNKNIRKALSLSIDRKAIVDTIGISNEIPAINFVPPVLKEGKNYPFIDEFNPIEAQKHLDRGLAELGIKKEDLENISLIYPQKDNSHQLCQIIQNNWHKHLGVNIPIEGVEFKTFLDKINYTQFSIAQYNWVAQYDDQMNILDRFKKKANPKNYSNWEHPDFIDLLDSSAYLDPVNRAIALEKAEAIIMDEMPIAPIMHGCSFRMIHPHVKGIFTSSIGSIHLEKIHLDAE